MKIERMRNLWLSGLIVTLLCLWSLPVFAGTAKLPPTGPWDAAAGKMAVPDYFSTANWAFSPPLTKFVDRLPGLGAANANANGQYLPVGTPDITTYPGSDYYEIELVEYSETMHSDMPPTRLRGYRQTNKGTDTSNCGAAPKVACTSANLTVEPPPIPHYLGPVLVATKDRPVRIKFTNNLPTGQAGDLFIPVDTTFMGAGPGPVLGNGVRGQGTPCASDAIPLPGNPNPNNCTEYTQNRATLHLHGGRTPWISDGTPHQWITPAAENTPYPKGVSVRDVPDMPQSDPLDGSQTFFYSNQQSARLMFYHDHAFGITRLNVYAGEAAGYLITDKWEQDLVARGILPADQIPLVIQDRTFVDATPTAFSVYDPNTLVTTPMTLPAVRVTDPLWNWGTGAADVNGVRTPITGDLWMPHVYMTNQNPYNPDLSGTNAFGRWFYGPWFYPPTVIDVGPQINPYFDADCADPTAAAYANCKTPGQPPVIPGTEHPSSGMEAFMDTAVVNGTAFPVLEVDPKAYRFRILNAANDRGMNLSIYKADMTLAAPAGPNARIDDHTEIKMVPAATPAPGVVWPPLWPVDGRLGGVPDPGVCTQNGAGEWNCSNWGPKFIQIGTEGGFLPTPVVRDPQPITYVTNPAAFWVGVVQDTGLALMPAERADVVVDFSAYAGQTLILYNDGPTAWPALDPRYDFFTDTPDMRDTGGYGAGGTYDAVTKSWTGGHGPQAGFGPNTRTVMQIKVRAGAPVAFNKAALDAEFTNLAPATALNPVLAAPASQVGKTLPLFQRAQEPIIVAQAAYQNAYPDVLIPTAFPWWGKRSSMLQHSLDFITVEGKKVSKIMEPKAIHDEMGASFDKIYGRMQSNLGMEIPNPTTNNANMIIYGYQDVPSETIINSAFGPVQVSVAPIGTLLDGTQIWNISHNGVDTHPIHFHIFDVQVINRIGWDGMLANPDPNEVGWKDTVRISPLMDTIVAVRPVAPLLPFGIPDSNRALNPALPIGSMMGFSQVDWLTNGAFVPPVTNQLTSFGWEYVWHCHILSHEEMDMMRPIVLLVDRQNMTPPVLTSVTPAATLTWTDATPAATATAVINQPVNEIGFRIQRCSTLCNDPNSYVTIATTAANSTSYTDTSALASSVYSYRVVAYNAFGPSASNVMGIATGSLVKPTITIDAPLTGASVNFGVGVPVTVTAAATAPATVAKVDYYINGTLYGSNAVAPYGMTITNASPGTLTITAKATDSDGVVSLSSNAVSINVVQAAAPASITVPAGSATGTYTVSWTASASAGATYTLEESTSPAFTTTTTVTSGGTALSAVISGKADSTTFYYRVMTVATVGSSPWTTGANGCVVSFPTVAPASITVPLTSTTGSYTVTWGASTTPGATYTLEESTVSNFASSTVVASGLAGLSQVISGKNNGTFYYRVKAVAAGFSTFPWTVGGNGCVVSLLPTVDAPVNGANVVLSVSIPFSATVPAITGLTFSRVDFFDNGVQVGTLAGAAPYSIPWVPGFIGTHNLSVIAYYSGGYSAMSNFVTVTANAAALPTITIDALPAAIDLGTPTPVNVTSVAPGYTLIGLYFSENGAFLSWANPGTTGITWTPATAGARTLTATAYYAGLLNPVTTAVGTAVTINGAVAPASITVPATSATGSYSVSWVASTTVGVTYTLQESTDPLFPATAATTTTLNAVSPVAISGKANGIYYYRVKAVKLPMADSAWVGGQIVVLLPPVTPTSPAPTGLVATTTPTYTWNESVTATSYDLITVIGGITTTTNHLSSICVAGVCSVVSPTIANNTDVYWNVRANNIAGSSNYTATTWFKINLIPVTPASPAPTGIVATTTPSYTWIDSAGAASYDLITVVNGVTTTTNYLQSAICSLGACTVVSPALTNGSNVYWNVRANSAAGSSSYTATTWFRVTVIPVTPTSPAPTGIVATATPSYTWNDSVGATSYDLITVVNGVTTTTNYLQSAICSLGACAVVSPALTNGSNVYWNVRANSAAGSSSYTATTWFRVAVIPVTPTSPAPTGIVATATPSYTWNDSVGATSYDLITVVNGVTTTTNYLQSAICSLGACSVASPALTNGSNVYWNVRANNAVGSSSYTATTWFRVAVVPATPTSPAPTGIVATATPTYSWNDSVGATSYDLITVVNGVTTTTNYLQSAICNLGACSVVSPALTTGTNVYWNVRANNAVGSSSYTATTWFSAQF